MHSDRIGTALLLAVMGAVLLAAAWGHGGTDLPVWNWCLMALGLTGLAYSLAVPRRAQAPPMNRAAAICIALLFAFVLLQLVPLPLAVLKVLSPARAELTLALSLVAPRRAAPLSIMPERTIAYLLRMGAFLIVYLLVRESGWRLQRQLWMAAVPLLLLAAYEAWAGLRQAYGDPPAKSAVGTCLNRDLYGGLIAMLVPFAALLAAQTLARQRSAPLLPVAFLSRLLGAAVLLLILLAALTQSLSRMAVAACIAGLAFAAVLFATRRSAGRARWVAIALTAGLALGVWIFAPQRLISRYGEIAATGTYDAHRLPIWKETLRLIADYPLTGCGLGCRKSAYLVYKSDMPLFSTDYAHSDYLQAIAELGVPGFLLALAAAGLLFREVVRAARTRHDPSALCLALACAASMASLALHSLVDFNLHQPVSMLVLAWTAGLGSACGIPAARPKTV